MSVWSIVEVVAECCHLLEHWRFLSCVLLGAIVASGAYACIAVDPWRWVAVVPIMLASIWIGGRWEHSKE